MDLQTGDILSVHHFITPNWKRIAQWIIRVLTLSEFDHTAIVIIENGKTYVVEAQFDCGIQKVPFEEWFLDGKKLVYVSRRFQQPPEHIMKSMVNMFVGRKKYDYLALWQQIWYQIGRRFFQKMKYIGRTDNGKADGRFYCSEFAAFVHDLDGWWKMTPGELSEHHEFRGVKIMENA